MLLDFVLPLVDVGGVVSGSDDSVDELLSNSWLS
jgi:hypothetical protein